jgi:hypothetical protein
MAIDYSRIAAAAIEAALDDGEPEPRRRPLLTPVRAIAAGAVLAAAARVAVSKGPELGRVPDFVRARLEGVGLLGDQDEPDEYEDEAYEDYEDEELEDEELEDEDEDEGGEPEDVAPEDEGPSGDAEPEPEDEELEDEEPEAEADMEPEEEELEEEEPEGEEPEAEEPEDEEPEEVAAENEPDSEEESDEDGQEGRDNPGAGTPDVIEALRGRRRTRAGGRLRPAAKPPKPPVEASTR